MKLPLIKSSNITSHKLITNKYKITEDNSKAKDNKQKLISTRLNEVQEIKIYLSQNFNAYDVDQNFIKDMEIEYAEQYLNKLEILPTKYLVNKLLSLRPLEKCDFYLTTESILTNEGEKTTKIVHIYPSNNNKNSVKKKNLNQSEGDKSNRQRVEVAVRTA